MRARYRFKTSPEFSRFDITLGFFLSSPSSRACRTSFARIESSLNSQTRPEVLSTPRNYDGSRPSVRECYTNMSVMSVTPVSSFARLEFSL